MRPLSSIALFTLVALFAAAGPAAAGQRRPNVIILLTDDQGYGDLSCHGNPVLKTPNLDRLHGQSVRFTDFHVAPMCTPTRGQLLTGQDALRNGATSVTAGRTFIRPGIPTAPEIFAAAGYRTGLFGKWHLGDNYPHRPIDRGFQESVYHLGWGFTAAPEFGNTLFDGRYFHNGVDKRFTGHCTDFWFDQAMRWMKERKEKNEPFFCYIPTNAPHAPHVVAKKYSDPYEGHGPAGFFGMIAQVDENVGRLEAFLRDNGLRDDTIFIYMTDNGGTSGVKLFNAGMRAGKTTYYDGGHRVPCFVRWPNGNLRPVGDVDVPAQNQDILPTLLELCGVPAPANAAFDGTSLAGLLRGTQTTPAERMLVVQYGQIIEKWDSCVIWNKWRLVKGKELYDLSADPAQKNDVSAAKPDVLAKMRAHYEKWWAGIEPKVNEFVATGIGSDRQPATAITSADWQGIYADNSNHVAQAVGGPRGGFWNVQVEHEGEYEIALRRWPRETGWGLAERAKAAFKAPDKALPIAGAKLTAFGREHSGKADSAGQEVVIRVKLSAGRTQLHAWFQDSAGNDLSGVFFAYIRRL
jgi:arylsulfatase